MRPRPPLRLFLAVLAGLAVMGLGPLGCDDGAGERETRVEYLNDSTPLPDDVYAVGPINVTINFSLDLVDGSDVSVMGPDGKEWTEGPVLVEDVGTALKRALRAGMPDGGYEVSYRACLANEGCREGSFSFRVDSALLSGYVDLRDRSEIVVEMSGNRFSPDRALVSAGTTVTWVNREEALHFVNTETHPEHTYFPAQNSLALARGATFSVRFDRSGQYDYHCSAHYPEGMVGSIVVEDR
ncbi:MAG: plastocyanin/azurin family copper-binding protein [Candidatus Geothermincolia bacterium]